MEHNKTSFLNNEVWVLTFGASFQRANVYKNTATNTQKKLFKHKLRTCIETIVSEKYQREVSEIDHLKNINTIIDFTRNYNKEYNILSNGGLNFGVSQKLLNLYLKYQWCLKEIPKPPHFPVDRRIQTILKMKEVKAWTKMDDEKEYIAIINAVKTLAEKEGKTSIAEYELKHFQRSQND